MPSVTIERVEVTDGERVVSAKLVRPELTGHNEDEPYVEYIEMRFPLSVGDGEIERAVREEAKRRCAPVKEPGPERRLVGKEVRL